MYSETPKHHEEMNYVPIQTNRFTIAHNKNVPLFFPDDNNDECHPVQPLLFAIRHVFLFCSSFSAIILIRPPDVCVICVVGVNPFQLVSFSFPYSSAASFFLIMAGRGRGTVHFRRARTHKTSIVWELLSSWICALCASMLFFFAEPHPTLPWCSTHVCAAAGFPPTPSPFPHTFFRKEEGTCIVCFSIQQFSPGAGHQGSFSKE